MRVRTRLLFHCKCTRFTVCFTYNYMLSMYIKSMLNRRWIILPVVYCRPFASKAVFWAILKDFEARSLLFLIVDDFNSKWRTQNPSKSLKKTAFEAKGRQYTTGKIIQRLFNVDLYTLIHISLKGEANGKSSTFTMKEQAVTHTLCGDAVVFSRLFRTPLWN